MNDPVEHALESQAFEVELRSVGRPLGEACLMNPYPQVAENQRHRYEEQSQSSVFSACCRIIICEFS